MDMSLAQDQSTLKIWSRSVHILVIVQTHHTQAWMNTIERRVYIANYPPLLRNIKDSTFVSYYMHDVLPWQPSDAVVDDDDDVMWCDVWFSAVVKSNDSNNASQPTWNAENLNQPQWMTDQLIHSIGLSVTAFSFVIIVTAHVFMDHGCVSLLFWE